MPCHAPSCNEAEVAATLALHSFPCLLSTSLSRCRNSGEVTLVSDLLFSNEMWRRGPITSGRHLVCQLHDHVRQSSRPAPAVICYRLLLLLSLLPLSLLPPASTTSHITCVCLDVMRTGPLYPRYPVRLFPDSEAHPMSSSFPLPCSPRRIPINPFERNLERLSDMSLGGVIQTKLHIWPPFKVHPDQIDRPTDRPPSESS